MTTLANVDLEKPLEEKQEFQIQLKNRFEILEKEELEECTAKAMLTVHECALEVAGKAAKQKEQKLKQGTKQLLKKRRTMVNTGTNKDNIEYVKLCKTIRKKVREDIRDYNTKSIVQAVENNRGIMKVLERKEGSKKLIPAMKEADRTVTTDRDRIAERCAEFYQGLYSRNGTEAISIAKPRNHGECTTSII